jgi:cholesterol transport system auxiliary component
MNFSADYVSGLKRWPMLVTIVVTLSACGLHRAMEPFSVIAPEIDTSQLEQGSAVPVDWGIAVRRPTTDRTRDSESILVRTGDFRLLPYSGAVWLDNAPDLLRASMVEALESMPALGAVGRTGRGRRFLVLETELRHFEALDNGSGKLVVTLDIRASLINPRGGDLLAAKSFSALETANSNTLDELVPAFERALTAYVAEMGDWVLQAARETEPYE